MIKFILDELERLQNEIGDPEDKLSRELYRLQLMVENNAKYPLNRLESALRYGTDMSTSKDICIKDAISLLMG